MAVNKIYIQDKMETLIDEELGRPFPPLDMREDGSYIDCHTGQRVPGDEPTETEAERQAIQAEATEAEKKQPGKNIPNTMKGFTVQKSYTNGIGSEEYLIDDLVIKRHIVTIIGESGTGKTAFFYFFGARHMAERGAKVYYIDADSPPSDHKKMMEYREKHNFEWIIPDVNEGQSVEKFKKTLFDLAKSQVEMEDTVWIFDTLKKFVNTMSKDSIKKFYALM